MASAPIIRRISRFCLHGSILCVLLLLSDRAVAQQKDAEANPAELELAKLLVESPGQRRPRAAMQRDETLSRVARARAVDMAKRRYFSHENPDGVGPNFLVQQARYPLPAHYRTDARGNNVESIGCGHRSVAAAWEGWMKSAGHKRHLLATDDFYQDQTRYGIGVHEDADSPFVRYYVVITAPPPEATQPVK